MSKWISACSYSATRRRVRGATRVFLASSVIKPLLDSTSYQFGLILGDVSFDKLDAFSPVMEKVSLIDIPWYTLPGNHDHNKDAKDDAQATETYKNFFGPGTYAFNYGKVHFIITDDVILPEPKGEWQYIGGLSDHQLTFIENDLKNVPADNLIVFAGHIQLFNSNPAREEFLAQSRQRLFAALSRFDHTLSVSAHTHYIRQVFFDEKHGWSGKEPHLHLNAGATCGDWYKGIPDTYGVPNTMMRDGSPHGYFSLDFSGNEFTYTYHASRNADFKDMSLYAGESLRRGEKAFIYADFLQWKRAFYPLLPD